MKNVNQSLYLRIPNFPLPGFYGYYSCQFLLKFYSFVPNCWGGDGRGGGGSNKMHQEGNYKDFFKIGVGGLRVFTPTPIWDKRVINLERMPSLFCGIIPPLLLVP